MVAVPCPTPAGDYIFPFSKIAPTLANKIIRIHTVCLSALLLPLSLVEVPVQSSMVNEDDKLNIKIFLLILVTGYK